MELCEEVQRRSEYIDWEEKVIRYARILISGLEVAPMDESDQLDVDMSEDFSGLVPIPLAKL